MVDPSAPAPAVRDERLVALRKRSWTVWGVGLAVFLVGVLVLPTVSVTAEFVVVLVGLALFVYSATVYLRLLRLSRRSSTAPAKPT